MSVTRINEFHAGPGRSDALCDFLKSIIGMVVSSPGCLACELLVDSEDASQLVILETWDSIAAHQAAAKIIPPEKIAEVMPLLAEPVIGRYYRPT